MTRSGNIIPPNIDMEMQELLDQVTTLLARLDGMAYTMPNIDLFIAMYVKKRSFAQ
jgi:hypothetical protein